MLENGSRRVAIEIDDETSHSKSLVASNKFYDDLLKQNSMVYLGWDVYPWVVRQMQIQPEAVKDELRVFLAVIHVSRRSKITFRLSGARHWMALIWS